MELPTMAIVSPKNPGEQWIINVQDFNPDSMIRWEDREQPSPKKADVDGSDNHPRRRRRR